MTDNLTPEARVRAMRAVKSKGTQLERKLYSMLAGLRIRGWKKSPGDVYGKPDIVFLKERIAIFVDGCFWHGCPICQRKLPKTNQVYWEQKISRNVIRDQKTIAALHNDGWVTLRVWEHTLRSSVERCAFRNTLRHIIEQKRHD